MTDKAHWNAGGKVARSARVSRRRLLKTAAGAAGAAVGSGLIKGFPTIWAQNIKDVVLNHVGPSYSPPLLAYRRAGQQRPRLHGRRCRP